MSAGAVEYTDCFSAHGVRPPNECTDMTLNNLRVPVMLERWGMWVTSSLPSLSVPLWPRVVTSDRVLSLGQIELDCVLMLNGIVSNRTVLTFKLRIYAKLNSLK